MMHTKMSLRTLLLPLLLAWNLPVFATITIATNTTWSSNATKNDDVLILDGAILTINNAAEITVNGSITAEPGAILDVNNGTLKMQGKIELQCHYTSPSTSTNGARLNATNAVFTSTSGSTSWPGIEVWGMTTVAGPGGVTHAWAVLTDAVIERAEVGICNYKGPTLANSRYGAAVDAPGGVIRALNCDFKNNNVAVLMKKYVYKANGKVLPARCYFNACEFICNTTPVSGTIEYALRNNFVVLNDIEGVFFNGCTFNDQTGSNISTGIKSHGAGFNVANYCPSMMVTVLPQQQFYHSCTGTNTISSFSGLDYGIEAFDNDFRRVNIHNSTFNTRSTAITLSGYLAPAISRNTITVNNPGHYFGIHLSGCTAFVLEENSIAATSYSGSTMIPGDPIAAGIVIVDAGEIHNEAYGNTVNSMDYAIQGVGNNRTDIAKKAQDGLVFLCNTVTNSRNASFDILSSATNYPQSGTVLGTTGISRFQVRPSDGPAGNIFDAKSLPSSSPNQLYQFSQPFLYFYGTTDPLEEPVYTNLSLTNLKPGTSVTCVSRLGIDGLTSMSTHNGNNGDYEEDIDVKIAISDPSFNDEVELNSLIANYCYDANRMINQYLNDTIIHIDSIEMVLNNMQYLHEYKLMQARLYMMMGEYDDAIELADDIPSLYDLTEDEEERVGRMKIMFEAIKALRTGSQNWGGDVTDDVASVMTNDDHWAKYMAQNLFMAYDGEAFELPYAVYIPEDTSGSKSSYSEQEHGVQQLAHSGAGIYPNPVKDNMVIALTSAGQATSFAIVNTTGQTVHTGELTGRKTVVPVASLAPGLYFVKLVDGSKAVEVKKLVKE